MAAATYTSWGERGEPFIEPAELEVLEPLRGRLSLRAKMIHRPDCEAEWVIRWINKTDKGLLDPIQEAEIFLLLGGQRADGLLSSDWIELRQPRQRQI
ncbi:hypothetical protein [Leucobacter sp. 1207-22]|uniref:hypothetical protein n=1 Tax=Leucobacter sp. 1207-22 TaxID=2604456 RepID=UPI0040639D2F